MKIAIVIIVAIIAIMGLLLFWHWYKKHATKAEKDQVNAWLLGAVAEAERCLADGTGPLQFSMVYGIFVSLFPELKIKIPVAMFEMMVKKILVDLKKLGTEKPKIQAYISGK